MSFFSNIKSIHHLPSYLAVPIQVALMVAEIQIRFSLGRSMWEYFFQNTSRDELLVNLVQNIIIAEIAERSIKMIL